MHSALPCPAPASDDRAAAVLRLNLREVLADLLARRVPQHVTVLDDDFGYAEADLHPTDAHELADDLIEDLACRGFVIGRAR
jgi:hypothetical protein